MAIPVQITFRGLPHSAAIAADIEGYAHKLERLGSRISRCKVVVEAPHQHQHQGRMYAVRVDLRMPRGEFAASRNSDADHSHEDLHVAVRDAFVALERQLTRGGQRRH
jgi:ribosome-associated translation inhibitor RaiA